MAGSHCFTSGFFFICCCHSVFYCLPCWVLYMQCKMYGKKRNIFRVHILHVCTYFDHIWKSIFVMHLVRKYVVLCGSPEQHWWKILSADHPCRCKKKKPLTFSKHGLHSLSVTRQPSMPSRPSTLPWWLLADGKKKCRRPLKGDGSIRLDPFFLLMMSPTIMEAEAVAERCGLNSFIPSPLSSSPTGDSGSLP